MTKGDRAFGMGMALGMLFEALWHRGIVGIALSVLLMCFCCMAEVKE
jgi:hypothetical protein